MNEVGIDLIERAMRGVVIVPCTPCQGTGETLSGTCPECDGAGATTTNQLEEGRNEAES